MIIEVSEDSKDKQWPHAYAWTEVINLQGIEITFKALGKRSIYEDPKGIQISYISTMDCGC